MQENTMKLWIIAYQYTQFDDEFDWVHYASKVEPTREQGLRIARENRRELFGLAEDDDDYTSVPDVLYINEAHDPLYKNTLERIED